MNKTECIETIFENVDLASTCDFLKNLLAQGSTLIFKKALCTEHEALDVNSDLSHLPSLLSNYTNCYLFMTFDKLYAPNFNISNCSFLIETYDDQPSLTMIFQESDIINVSSHFCNWCASCAKSLKASTYYCGLEPAEYTTTRFFTEQTLGPLHWPQSCQGR